MRSRAGGGLIRVVFGGVRGRRGMSAPRVVRAALLFHSAYLFLFFASAVAVAAAGLEVLRRRRARALLADEPIRWQRERPQRRHVTGSLLFGAGWGLSNAC